MNGCPCLQLAFKHHPLRMNVGQGKCARKMKKNLIDSPRAQQRAWRNGLLLMIAFNGLK
jgi:hypothetical protein